MSAEQYMARARQLFDERFRVRFNFDGAMVTTEGGRGEKRRAVGFDGDKSTFTWKRFISLEDSYNPYPGQLNPWSLKAWYKWGCRKFHFHNPFGKVAQGNVQGLVYEVDQYLTAKNGLTVDGVVQNTPMPWLVNDFVTVMKALTSGQRGTLDQATWDAWTVGSDAWFKPTEPIDLIVYIGGMADPSISDDAYAAYIRRWNSLFNTNPTEAAKRLNDSVAPLIEAKCRIGFDAAVASPGAMPGWVVPLTVQGMWLQKGWWNFWVGLGKKIGKNRMYVESYPFKKYGMANSYLGYNVIADDDWSFTKHVLPGEDGPHMTSEMGDVEFWRAIWQNSTESTPLIGSNMSTDPIMERYWFLKDHPHAFLNKTTDELRLKPADCCASGHNYYWGDVYGDIIAYHMLEKQNTRWETNERGNITRSGILVPHALLQVLPESFQGDPAWGRQFGKRFETAEAFVGHLVSIMDKKKDSETSIYCG